MYPITHIVKQKSETLGRNCDFAFLRKGNNDENMNVASINDEHPLAAVLTVSLAFIRQK